MVLGSLAGHMQTQHVRTAEEHKITIHKKSDSKSKFQNTHKTLGPKQMINLPKIYPVNSS